MFSTNAFKSVKQERISIPQSGGGSVRGLWLSPSSGKNCPGIIIYFPGGGFTLPATAAHLALCREYVTRTGYCCLFVNYSLAPQNVFPKALEECYVAFEYARQKAQERGLGDDNIVLMGDSAGGNLAAAVAQRAHDQGFNPGAQMLIYPVLDNRCATASCRTYTDTPLWNGTCNQKMWALYLRDCSAEAAPEYASPASREDLTGLPTAYVEPAEFDPLHDEAVEYAKRLEAANVDTRLYITRGTVHAFDHFAAANPLRRDAIERRIEFLSGLR